MNSNNLLEIAQKSFRIAIGATAYLVETIQDPEKRSTAITELQEELSQKTQQWSQKGELTEQEARRMLENLMGQQKRSNPTTDNTANNPTESERNAESELQELTKQLIALRNELEQLQKN